MKDTYLNSPLRVCETCAHLHQFDDAGQLCRKFRLLCSDAVHLPAFCGVERVAWVPKPPKPPKQGWLKRLWKWVW